MMYAILQGYTHIFKHMKKKHILSDIGERNGEVTGGNTEQLKRGGGCISHSTSSTKTDNSFHLLSR